MLTEINPADQSHPADDQSSVMIVDDELANRRKMLYALSSNYVCIEATNASDCLNKLDLDNPTDAFLLNIRPPNKSGYELCRELRSIPALATTPVVFLSELDSTDDLTLGFGAGADDFILKPFNLDSLLPKLDRLIFNGHSAKSQISHAQELAKTAMENCGEIGVINQFLSELKNCTDFSELADHTIAHCRGFAVNAAVALHLDDTMLVRSTTGSINHLESELIQRGRYSERIVSLGNKCLFNFNGCSLLIRTMPEDSDKAGRYRDHLASLLSGVETRMQSIHSELSLKSHQQKIIQGALSEARQSLNSILDEHKEHGDLIRSILDDFSEELQLTFSYIDLSEEQEEKLRGVVSTAVANITALYKQGLEIDRGFSKISAALKSFS